MSERYSRLFTLPENLYSIGSPVLIAAGTLLKDNQTGKIVAQLKFQSISNKIIKAVKVSLNLFDTAGTPIGEAIEYDYLDLHASRDTKFGQKTPVPVSEVKARSYKVAVTEVVFGDQSIWSANSETWGPLSRPVLLQFNDPELLKQYQIKFGRSSTYTPEEQKDLWYCTCGELNHKGEACHKCHKSLFELQSLDMAELAAEKDARLSEENRQAAKEKAAVEAQKRKTAKFMKIMILSVCVITAFVMMLNTVVIPSTQYNKANILLNEEKYTEAILLFKKLGNYRDSALLAANAENSMIAAEKAKLEAEKARIEAENAAAYTEAVSLFDAGEYDAAIVAFTALGNYRDSVERVKKAKVEAQYAKPYAEAVDLFNSGKFMEAAIAFGVIRDYRDAKTRSFELWNYGNTISAASYHTLGIKTDGTVLVAGKASGALNHGQSNVGDWKDIVSISANAFHSVGLKCDGTVVAVGRNDYGECRVKEWQNIVAISTGISHTVGLKVDGTVVTVGDNGDGQCNTESWKNIVAICAGDDHTVGLKSDGTVLAVGSNFKGQCNVSKWQDIIAISAGWGHTVGLKADGTVVTAGSNWDRQCNVGNWRNIVAICAGDSHTVGLKSDGTVVAVGYNEDEQCNVSSWRDVVAISAGREHTVGLKSNGTAISTDKIWDKGKVESWRNIKINK